MDKDGGNSMGNSTLDNSALDNVPADGNSMDLYGGLPQFSFEGLMIVELDNLRIKQAWTSSSSHI